jgi:hypothetical protein
MAEKKKVFMTLTPDQVAESFFGHELQINLQRRQLA